MFEAPVLARSRNGYVSPCIDLTSTNHRRTHSPAFLHPPLQHLPPPMPPKRSQISSNAQSVPPIPKSSSTSTTSPSSSHSRSASASYTSNQSAQDVMNTLWDGYVKKTPQRTKLLDVFLAFLVVVGGLQFVYCLIVGNYVRLLFHLHHPFFPPTTTRKKAVSRDRARGRKRIVRRMGIGGADSSIVVALQCLLGRLFGNGGTIRFDC